MSLETALLSAIKDHPDEAIHLMAYRDWLIDHDRHEELAQLDAPVNKIEDLAGRVLLAVERDGDDLVFTLINRRKYKLTPIYD